MRSGESTETHQSTESSGREPKLIRGDTGWLGLGQRTLRRLGYLGFDVEDVFVLIDEPDRGLPLV